MNDLYSNKLKRLKIILSIFFILSILGLSISLFFPSILPKSIGRDLMVDTFTSISSAIIASLGVMYTIEYTKNQSDEDKRIQQARFDEDKRIQIKPRPNIILQTSDLINTLSEIIIYKTEAKFSRFNKNHTLYILSDMKKTENVELLINDVIIENLGLGPLMNTKITIVKSDTRDPIFCPVNPNSEPLWIGNIKDSISIKLVIELIDICLEKNTDVEDFTHLAQEDITVSIEYEDLLYNKYLYTFPLNISLISYSYTVVGLHSIQRSAKISYDKCSEEIIS